MTWRRGYLGDLPASPLDFEVRRLSKLTEHLEGSDRTKIELIRMSLETAVPLYIMEIKMGSRRRLHDDAAKFAHVQDLILSKGDHFIYRGKHTAEVFNAVAEAIANLAFAPGGVQLFGLHFQA